MHLFSLCPIRFVKRTLLTSCITLLLFLTGCNVENTAGGGTSIPTTGKQKKTKLKIASFYNLNIPILGDNLKHLKERTETASNGSISVKLYNPGELVGSMELLDAVSAGKIDAGYSASGFWMGKMPASPLFSAVPFGPNATEYLAWFYNGNGMKLYQEMYDQAGFDVKVLLCAMIPPETSGWFTKEIKTPEDLKGIKMRFYGLGGTVMQKLGVSVTILPGGELFPAMEKGIIDATEFSSPLIDENLKFYKLAKYNYFPGWHQQTTAFELLINKSVWKKLPAHQKTILEMACKDTIIQGIASGEASQSAVMQRNEQEHGVINATWSPEMIKLFRKTWLEVVEEQSSQDPFFHKVWNDLNTFRSHYKIWGDKAYIQ